MLESDVAERLFGRLDPLGTLGPGRRAALPGHRHLREARRTSSSRRARRPAASCRSRRARESFQYDETNALFIAVKPRPGSTVGPAMDAVTVALRRVRNLRPGDAQHLRPDHPGPDPRRGGQLHLLLLPGDGGALQRRAAGGRHRRHGDHDGLGHRPDPGDRPPKGARRHPARDPLAVPGGGRHPDAARGGARDRLRASGPASCSRRR